MPAPVLVLACGALDRTDDAAGLLAARALADRLAARGVELEAVGDLSVDDLSERDPATRFVIVDAAYGPAPGEVVRLPFAALPGSRAKPRSSHELPIPEMLGLAELLAGRPLRGELVAIGIASAGFGDVLTPAVSAGMPRFVDAVLAAVEEALGHGGEPVPGDGSEAAPGVDAALPIVGRFGRGPSRRAALPMSPRRRAARWHGRSVARR